MIAYLRGRLVEETVETITLETGGVGYELTCSKNTLDDFFGCEEVEAWVYTHVREDLIQLFGFSRKTEKQIFESLIKVNGIGPKLACRVLSGATIEQITSMIEKADAKGLAQLPKIGKKTAEQIILTLKGKLQLVDSAKPKDRVREQVISALVNLGFKNADVETVVDELPEPLRFDEGVRDGLAALSGGQ